jgi:hypothetical protein
MKAHRIGLSVALGVGSCALGWLGCSSDDNAATILFADSGIDTSVSSSPDASGTDAGGDAFVLSPQCVPGPVTTPTWSPPAGPQSVCTTAQIDAILTDCTNPTLDPTKCAADTAATPACAACIFGADGGAGALITTQPNVFFVNYPGCIAIETIDAGASSCAATQGALLACQNGACTQCPADPGGGISQIEACNAVSEADGGPCASYAGKVTCNGLPSAVASTCYVQPGDSFQPYAERVAAVFCGGETAPTDGGTDAPSSADGGDAGTPGDASDDGG